MAKGKYDDEIRDLEYDQFRLSQLIDATVPGSRGEQIFYELLKKVQLRLKTIQSNQ